MSADNRIYTLKEIEEDVWSFEGVKIVFKSTITDPVCIMKYSEFFRSRLPGDATVTELQNRINMFKQACII